MPEPASRRRRQQASTVDGLAVLYDDDDVVVVDKPVGVAAHPSPGWTGPTVIGGLAADGLPHRDLRRGRAAGHRPPAGRRHHRRHGRRQERAAPTRTLKRAFKERDGRQALQRARPGPPRPDPRHHRRAHRPAPGRGLQVRRRRRRPAERDALRHRGGVPRRDLLDIHLETGRTHQIRVHMAAVRHPCVGDLTYGADPMLARHLGLSRQWLHARDLGVRAPGHRYAAAGQLADTG